MRSCRGMSATSSGSVPKDPASGHSATRRRPGAVRADVYYINPDPAHKLRLPTDDDVRRWSHGKLDRNCTPCSKREPGSENSCHPAWERDRDTLDEF